MVKIVNPMGDVKIGKQGEVVYQRHYGQQTRRLVAPKRAIASEAQVAHRQLYRAALDWRKGLSRPNRRYLEGYCIANGVVDSYHIPLPWHRFALKCYLEHIHFVIIDKPSFTSETGEKVFEKNEETEGSEIACYGSNWVGQTFTPQETHTINKVALWIKRYGASNSYVFTLAIRNTDGEGKPTGGDLTSEQVNGSDISTDWHWQEIPITNKIELQQGVKYALVWRYTGTSTNKAIRQKYNTGNPYANGDLVSSANGGSTWSIYDTYDTAFKEWGEYQEETSVPGLLHVRHPALLTVVHKRGEAIVSVSDNLSSLDEEYLTKQVGIDVEAGDSIEATTVAGVEYKYQVH